MGDILSQDEIDALLTAAETDDGGGGGGDLEGDMGGGGGGGLALGAGPSSGLGPLIPRYALFFGLALLGIEALADSDFLPSFALRCCASSQGILFAFWWP